MSNCFLCGKEVKTGFVKGTMTTLEVLTEPTGERYYIPHTCTPDNSEEARNTRIDVYFPKELKGGSK